MSAAGNFFVRWRVRLGYPLAMAVLYFSRPISCSILLGAMVGIVGLWLRAYAAGYLHKQEVLTVTGPYAYTRNPLYFGSAILALGAGIATRSWISALILIILFHSDGARGERTPPAPRRVFRGLRTRRPAFCSAPDRREAAWRLGRFLLFRAIQEESRMAGRRRLSTSSLGLAGGLALPSALMLPRLPHLDTQQSM